jgi:hypothetical protein
LGETTARRYLIGLARFRTAALHVPLPGQAVGAFEAEFTARVPKPARIPASTPREYECRRESPSRGMIFKHPTPGKVRGGGPPVDVHAGSGAVTVE